MALSAGDVESVYLLLLGALSPDESSRKAAEASLTECATRPGFCSCLLEIISRQDLDAKGEARWLAAVYFKNSVNRYWRGRRETPGIGDAEKPHLRAKLLDLLGDKNEKVAVQLSVLISKIARIDYPREWPDLFASLLARIQSPAILQSQRAYLVLNQLLKELSTKRLGVDQRNFAQITRQLFDHCWSHWTADVQTVVNGFTTIISSASSSASPSPPPSSTAAAAGGEGGALVSAIAAAAAAGGGGGPVISAADQLVFALSCERWLLCLRCVKRMVQFGFESDYKSVQEVSVLHQIIPAYLQALNSLLQFRTASLQRPSCSPLLPFLQRSCLKLIKSIVVFQETHPFSCAANGRLLPILDFCFGKITEPLSDQSLAGSASSSPSDASFQLFLIQTLLFLQNVLKSVAYKHTKSGRVVGEGGSKEEAMGVLADQARQQISAFFDANKVVFLCNIIMQRFFVLTADDLEEWASDPESFHLEQDLVQWKDHLRPCAEALYLVLFESYKETLAPLVIQHLNSATEACPPAPPAADVIISPALLLKDAAYCAMGVAAYDLHDYLDLQQWFSSVLPAELANQHPNNRIIRRRIAWLLGQWVSKIKDEMRRPVYQIIVSLLGNDDVAVQLAACQSLRCLIDDVNFYEEQFAEFAEASLMHLFNLILNKLNEFDAQLQVINTVSLIIERLGDKIAAMAPKILALIPQLWDKSEGQSLLRIQIICSLQRLLVALGPQSPSCYSVLFPILNYSTDISQPDELNVLEDGMHLWRAAISHAPLMVPPLLDLFPNLVAIMGRSFEHLPIAISIIESYVLLGGASFLQQHISRLVQILDCIIGNVNEKGMLATMGAIDLLLQSFPLEAPAALERILQKLLLIAIGPPKPSGSASNSAISASSVAIDSGNWSDLVRITAATILARVLLQNTPYFAQLLGSSSTAALLQQQTGGVSPLLLFVDALLERADSLSSARRRRLVALSLCSLLTFQEQQILDRLDLIVSVCTSALSDSSDDADGSSLGYSFEFGPEHDAFGNHAEREYQQRRQVVATDPVSQLSVALVLQEKIQAATALHGQDAINAAMNKVPPALLQQVQQAIAVNSK